MLTSEQQKHKPKQSKIRYTEYYDPQSIFDSLYADSLNGKTFQNLMRFIVSEENIKLAYRTIKGNKGSGTPGVDKRTIKDLAALREGGCKKFCVYGNLSSLIRIRYVNLGCRFLEFLVVDCSFYL